MKCWNLQRYMERRVGGRKPMFMGNLGSGLNVHSTIARVGGGEDVQLPAKAEPGFVCWVGTIAQDPYFTGFIQLA